MGFDAEPRAGAASFFAALALLLASGLSAQENWVAVRAGQFEVYSNAGARRASETAVVLQTMTAAMKHASGLNVELPLPLRVLIFATRSEFTSYATPLFRSSVTKSGVALSSDSANFILLDGTVIQLEPVVRHELAHQFLNNTHTTMPLWYSEGMAEFYAAYRLERDGVELGRAVRPSIRNRMTRQRLIPIRDFFLADESSDWYTRRGQDQRWYAQASAVVHFLMIERPEKLTGFVELMNAGVPLESALARAFGMTAMQFERELQLYLQRPILSAQRVRTGRLIIDPPGPPRSVPAEEMAGVLAELAAMGQ